MSSSRPPANPILADVVRRLVAVVAPTGQPWTAVAYAAGVHYHTLYHLRKGLHRPGAEYHPALWRTLRRLEAGLHLPPGTLLPRLPAPRTPGQAVQQALLAADREWMVRDVPWLAATTGLSASLLWAIIAGTYPYPMTAQVRARLRAALPALAASAFFAPAPTREEPSNAH